MSTNTNALRTLIELSTTKVDDAAKRLGHANNAVKAEEEKLQMLQNYCLEYDERFKAALMRGMTPVMYHNFQAFIVKMQDAVRGQTAAVTQAQQRVEHARRHWQDMEKERLSYNTLVKRAEQTARAKEARREQKDTDERANRMAFSKK